jgi:solute:Na+ symporter, SSS family
MLDALIILGYFVAIMVVAVRARLSKDVSAEDYFVCGRNLRWYSIAASTIATNLHAGHFLAVIGSAYAFGLAQANFELNAVFGLLMAAFIFVPLYLRAGVVTITQFIEQKFGSAVAVSYSALTMFLYGTLYLGGTLFWGGYALEVLYGTQIQALIGGNAATHICVMIVLLGSFSAVYTYFGGLGAVVKTDIIQFVLLLGGGVTLAWLALDKVGGFAELQRTAGDKMHLHLPNSHQQLPWLGILAMNLLNLQYWGCNQVILQRSLAARSLRDAQIGLLAGGFFKFLTAGMLVLPGIALIGILGPGKQLDDPDQAYIRVVEILLSPGVKGLVLCGLFASLMSSVDSIFNSISTLWSIDFYKRRIRPEATDAQVVAMGRKSIIGTLLLGILFGFVFTYIKLAAPEFPLDPFFKKTSYFIKNGFVILIAAAVFLYNPSRKLVLGGLLFTIPLTIAVHLKFSSTPYLILTSVVILVGFLVVAVPTILKNGWRIPDPPLVRIASPGAGWLGLILGGLLILAHVVFH